MWRRKIQTFPFFKSLRENGEKKTEWRKNWFKVNPARKLSSLSLLLFNAIVFHNPKMDDSASTFKFVTFFELNTRYRHDVTIARWTKYLFGPLTVFMSYKSCLYYAFLFVLGRGYLWIKDSLFTLRIAKYHFSSIPKLSIDTLRLLFLVFRIYTFSCIFGHRYPNI